MAGFRGAPRVMKKAPRGGAFQSFNAVGDYFAFLYFSGFFLKSAMQSLQQKA